MKETEVFSCSVKQGLSWLKYASVKELLRVVNTSGIESPYGTAAVILLKEVGVYVHPTINKTFLVL